MKSGLKTVLVASLTTLSIGLFGCGASPNIGASGTEVSKTEGNAATTQGEYQKKEFDDVVLVDNDTVKITLDSFYQNPTNLATTNGSVEIVQDNIVTKATSKGKALNIFCNAYLNGEKLYAAMLGGSVVEAGKSANLSYWIAKDTKPDPSKLDSFDDLSNLELQFEVSAKNDDGAYGVSETYTANLKDAIAGKASTSNAAGTSEKAPDKSNDGQAKKTEEVQTLNAGDVITTDKWEVTYVGADITNEVLPSDTSGYSYMSYEANAGTKLVNLIFDVKCLSSDAGALSDALNGGKITYGDKYNFDTTEVYYDMGQRVRLANRLAVDPLQTLRVYYMICNLPEDADTAADPVVADINVAGKKAHIIVR